MTRISLLVAVTLAASSAGAAGWSPDSVPPSPSGEFRRKRSRISARMGRSHHSAVDVVVAPGQSASIEGKFAYGKLSKDLEHEDVTLYLERGERWKRIESARTNHDGRARFEVPGALLRRPGAHRVALVVHGDKTKAFSTIWVLPRGHRVVVFDIDGTLTTGDSEIVGNTLTGDPIAMRPDADALAEYWAKNKAQPIYLTGRPYMYNASTRRWLQAKGFPRGPVITVKFVGQARPSSGGVGAFKQRWLTRLVERGYKVLAAYGNAKTDVCAFAKAGIPPRSTFIIGKHGGRACSKGRRYPPSQGIPSFGAHLRQLTGR
jgi:phosphatidate phosphatase PAH1